MSTRYIPSISKNWRIAIALPFTYYILVTLDNTIHELGHLLTAQILGAKPIGLFIAPSVVGYARWNYGSIPEVSIPIVDFWVTAGGVAAELVLGIVLLSIVWILRDRLRGWTGFMLVMGGLILISMGAFYLLFSWIVDWGDGAELVRLGLSPYALVGFVVVILVCIYLIGTPLIARCMSEYTSSLDFRTTWSYLTIMGLPVQLYGVVKSFFFLPGEYQVGLYSLVAYVLISVILAMIIALRGRAMSINNLSGSSVLSYALLASLGASAMIIEISCTKFFGLGNNMRFLWFN